MRSCLGLGFLVLLSLGSGASAGERFARGGGYGGYGYPVGYGDGYGGYGFAGGVVDGGYIGAPLTQFPRPSAIVPPVWGYGTYGVPTMTGIRQAPVGDPKILVVHGAGPSVRRGSPRPWSDPASNRGAGPAGPHVVSVTVPRR